MQMSPGLAKNASTGGIRSGGNLLLPGAVIAPGFCGQNRLTFRQAFSPGGNVRKGERCPPSTRAATRTGNRAHQGQSGFVLAAPGHRQPNSNSMGGGLLSAVEPDRARQPGAGRVRGRD